MVVMFAERGDWEDYSVEILGVCEEKDAPTLCMRFAERFVPQATKRDYGNYNYHLRWLREGDEPRCSMLNSRFDAADVGIFPEGSVVLVAVSARYSDTVNKAADEMHWVVTWKSVPLEVA